MAKEPTKSEYEKVHKSEYGVHKAHCCILHGCKYGQHKNCPVVRGELIQEKCHMQEFEPCKIVGLISKIRSAFGQDLLYEILKVYSQKGEFLYKLDVIQIFKAKGITL